MLAQLSHQQVLLQALGPAVGKTLAQAGIGVVPGSSEPKVGLGPVSGAVPGTQGSPLTL